MTVSSREMLLEQSMFGQALDELAREAGGWPVGAIVHTVEVVGGGNDPMVLLSGGIPNGVKASGRPQFDRKAAPCLAGVKLSEYRIALKARAAQMGEASDG